jgi:uncharacterized lipoprotein YajG
MPLRLLLPLAAIALLGACRSPDPRANTMVPVNATVVSPQSVDMMDDSIETAAQ